MLVMSQMAKEPETVLSAAALAHALHLSVPTVSKVLKILAESGLVGSVRGAEGGYHLARKATEISVAEVISAMEGVMSMTVCCESASLCGIHASCTTKENWKKINKTIYAMLASLSLHDMLTPLPQGLFHGK